MSERIKIKISSTALGSSSCIKKFVYTVIEGYKTIPSSSIVYGTAFHKFIDVMYKFNGDIGKAKIESFKVFNVPKTSKKQQEHLEDERHLLGTCLNVWSSYVEEDSHFDVLSLNGVPATEQTFSILIFENEKYEVYLEGTIDTIGQIKNGCFAIRDWKTTSSWDPKNYFKRYELSRQLRIYTLACKLMAQKEPDSTLGKIGATHMGSFIDAVFLKKVLNEGEVKRSEVFQYSANDLLAIKIQIDDFIQKLIHHLDIQYFPKEGILNGSCEGKYGLCAFWNCCKADEKVEQLILNRDFKKVKFDPLDYNGD